MRPRSPRTRRNPCCRGCGRARQSGRRRTAVLATGRAPSRMTRDVLLEHACNEQWRQPAAAVCRKFVGAQPAVLVAVELQKALVQRQRCTRRKPVARAGHRLCVHAVCRSAARRCAVRQLRCRTLQCKQVAHRLAGEHVTDAHVASPARVQAKQKATGGNPAPARRKAVGQRCAAAAGGLSSDAEKQHRRGGRSWARLPSLPACVPPRPGMPQAPLGGGCCGQAHRPCEGV